MATILIADDEDEVRNLVKSYSGVRAVNGISFDVREGEIFGMVGPNGAGKTTTIECIEGLRHPDTGVVKVLGMNPYRNRNTERTEGFITRPVNLHRENFAR